MQIWLIRNLPVEKPVVWQLGLAGSQRWEGLAGENDLPGVVIFFIYCKY